MTTLIVICSKSPNNTLPECVELLYKIQIDQNSSMYKMCIIDSDSDDFANYEIINKNFPEVEIHYVKNKSFEYGAWKYALELYPDYDNYFCIQDSMLAFGCIFIVNNNIMKDIFNTFKIPPIDKDGSCFYERNFGLYFIIKNIDTVDLKDHLTKISGGRR